MSATDAHTEAQLVETRHEGAVRVISLARPDRRNALTPAMADALLGAVAAAHESTTRCLVLTGQGGMFCSGFDLALCEADRSGHTMRRLLASLSEIVRALRRLPCPVVIAAQGGAIAGGNALLGGGDLVIADRGAKFGYPVVRLGVSPAVSAPTLIRAVTPGIARRVQLDPGLIDAAEAHKIGLVNELVDGASDVLPLAQRHARALAQKPPEAVAATRNWLTEVEDAALGPLRAWADAALATSLGLVGGEEERRLLRAPPARPGKPTG